MKPLVPVLGLAVGGGLCVVASVGWMFAALSWYVGAYSAVAAPLVTAFVLSYVGCWLGVAAVERLK